MKIGIEGPKTLKMNMIIDLWKKGIARDYVLLQVTHWEGGNFSQGGYPPFPPV